MWLIYVIIKYNNIMLVLSNDLIEKKCTRAQFHKRIIVSIE